MTKRKSKSSDLLNNVKSFEVDSHKNWTPFSLKKIGPDTFDKKPSDHCAIMLTLEVTNVKQKYKKTPVINFKNPQGWERYKVISDKFAGKMLETIKEESDIDKLEIKMEMIKKSWGQSRGDKVCLKNVKLHNHNVRFNER